MPVPLRRFVVQWPRLAPYHLPRLDGLLKLFSAEGVEVVSLETAGNDRVYGWQERLESPVTRRVLFPGSVYESIAPRTMAGAVRTALDTLRPDAVAIHSYSLPDARACIAWCRSRRKAAVCMTDSKLDDAPRTWAREAVKQRIVSGFDAALTAGSLSRDYLGTLGMPADRVFFGFGIVDNERIARAAADARGAPAPDLPGLDDPAPFFLSSNRFLVRKNLPRLLTAYAAYRRRTESPWRLVLLGDGPLRGDLEGQIARERIDGVVLPGFRTFDQITAYYGRAGALVHPSLLDQWALVVNEALACGLPVIVSTGTGCHPELVRDGENGFLFDPTDTDALTAAMVRLADPATDREAMGRRGRTLVADWGPDRFASGMMSAVRTGLERADRRFDPALRLILAAMERLARSTSSFHAVEV